MLKRLISFALTLLLVLALVASAGLAAGLLEGPRNAQCLRLMNVPADLAPGDHPVRIALVDSGISQSQFLEEAEILAGYNFVFQNANTRDHIGHGSRAVSVITGGSLSNQRLVGLGGHAEIVPLVWISRYPSGVGANGGVKAVTDAIRNAIDIFECQIVNISAGLTLDDPELKAAVLYAEERGVIVVSAVGNSNMVHPELMFYPAAYETVVGVGSVRADFAVSEFSQRNNSVMVTAPGERVLSLAPGQRVSLTPISGTSFAAAHVTGLASLILSHYPDLTPGEFRHILSQSSQDLGKPGYDIAYGYGVVDVAAALLTAEILASDPARHVNKVVH